MYGERRNLFGLSMAVVLLLVGGCSGIKESTMRTITSDPSGATVLASGVEVGKTPLRIVPDDIFPPRFVGLTYRSSGLLSIRKAGCTTYTIPVDDHVFATDLHVKLKCDPTMSGNHAKPAAAAGAEGADQTGEDVATRLRRLQSLHEQHLITDQEYQRLRQKILNGL